MQTSAPTIGQAKHWLHAVRPKTLTIAIVPVVVGTVLGYVDTGRIRIVVGLAALAVSVLIQAGTNLHNDAADFERGADDPTTRLGPPRATAQGWFSSADVRLAAGLCFLAAIALGCYLIAVGGWPVVAIGVVSIVAGVSYSGGPRPVAYTSLGELFVFVFFGLVAVGGSYYLQTMSITPWALLAGAVVGLPAAAVLVVNNYRDLDADRRIGRRTVAVRWGRRVSRWQYAALMLGALVLAPLVHGSSGVYRWSLLTWLLIPWAGGLVGRFWREQPGPAFNRLLASTARFQLALGLLLGGDLLLELPPG